MSHTNNPFWHIIEEYGSAYLVDLRPRIIDYQCYEIDLPRHLAVMSEPPLMIDPEQLWQWDNTVEACTCDCEDRRIVIAVPENYGAGMRLSIAADIVREHYEQRHGYPTKEYLVTKRDLLKKG